MKLLRNNLEIIISCFVSHVTTSGTEMKLFQPLKEFRNYFNIISTTVMNMLENIQELRRPFSEIISSK